MRLLFLLAVYLSYGSHLSYGAPDGTDTPDTTNAPFFREGDVVALVGGEDMVVAAELGYLEALIQRALPAHKLKFRSLAWEGDTVFEQPRQVNYPTLEAQLDDIGATVVICQFGQMESLAGKDKLPEFIAAYEALLGRLSGGGKRRIILVPPKSIFDHVSMTEDSVPALWRQPALPKKMTADRRESAWAYTKALEQLAGPHRSVIEGRVGPSPSSNAHFCRSDGLHWNASGQEALARNVARATAETIPYEGTREEQTRHYADISRELFLFDPEPLTALVAAKNRMWFNYYRPQNWAFLAGDWTNQPSSRDHLDLSKRWFPEEMKQWLPLIEAKEKEIWALAAKLAQGGQ